MYKSRIALGCIALVLALALLIPLVSCKSSGTTSTPTPTATTTGAVATASPTPAPTLTSTPQALQGTLTGTYSGQGPSGPENGTLSITIYGNGTIEGSFAGTHIGTLKGQVDTSGNLNATGTAGIGVNATQITWQGKVTQSGKSLNIQGTWSGSKRSGTFSGTGNASPITSPSSGNILVTSDDGSISLSVPSGWNTHDTSLWPSAAIGVSNDANSQYVVVVNHPDATLPTNYTLNEFLTDVKSASDLIATNTVWGQTSNISIGGLKGITVELTGTGKMSHSNFVYWINLLQGKNNFYNVTGWTVNNMADTNKPIIENVINSFKEMH